MAVSQPISNHWKRNFFIIWTGQAFSLLGSTLVQFALVWYLTQKTGSATVLSMATLVALLPQIALAPFVGALVDRWNRRVVMIVSDSLLAVLTIGLVILFATGAIQVWHILVVIFFRGLGGLFQFTAMQASTTLMVPEDKLSRISGLNQALNGAMNIVAPPLGALLLGLLPMYAVLSVDIITAAMAVVPLFFIFIPQPVAKVAADAGVRGVWMDIRSGWRYVRAWPGLVGVTVIAMLVNLVTNPVNALYPLLVTQVYGKGVVELGWVDAVAGVGIVVSGLLLSVWGGFRKKVWTMLLGLVGIGAGILLTGLAPTSMFVLALAGVGVLGLSSPMVDGPLFAIVQAKVAPEMQGRVVTLIISVAKIATPISMIISGPVADALGLRFWYIFGGIVTILVSVGAAFIPAVRNIEDHEDEDAVVCSVKTLSPEIN